MEKKEVLEKTLKQKNMSNKIELFDKNGKVLSIADVISRLKFQ